jgi:hypothetical protein
VRATGKNVVLSPLGFVGQQILLVHPITFPIWLAGLAGLLVGRLRRFRVLGWTYLVLLATMVALGAKSYYLAPIYPMLMAAGGVVSEGFFEARIARGRWARAVVLVLVVLTGAVFAPLALPILPPDAYVAYAETLGVQPERTEVGHVGALPQLFGDQFGWPELVAEVARIYHSLPLEERDRTGILASNYGEAGAINLFGPALGLPRAICAHQTHFFWGPTGVEPENLIVLQWPREDLEQYCGSVEQAGVHFHPWGMDEENRPIFLCRDPVMTLAEAWPQLKHWN